MKTLGIIGGMSWESSQVYYQLINQTTQRLRGGLHSAPLLLYSVDFAAIEALQHQEDWATLGDRLVAVAQRLEQAGAEGLVIATNTMHKLAESVQAAITIPLLHIADATGDRVTEAGLSTVGLLGTRFTMEQGFYGDRLAQRHGLEVVIPEAPDRADLHRIIYDELCQGVLRPESRSRCREMMAALTTAGAEGIILGCTELELLIQPEDAAVPLFPTTRIHAEAAVHWALGGLSQ
jgi:aspartate racemase